MQYRPAGDSHCWSSTGADRGVALSGFFKGTELPNTGWWEALWPDPAAVVTKLGVAPGLTVLDLCCGDGWFTLPLARISERVIAVDIDRELLDSAELRLTENALNNCEFVCGDALDLHELVSERVDFVFMANAFHGVPEPTRLAETVGRVLKPRGRFAIVNWQAWPREQTIVLGEPRGPASELRLGPDKTIAAVEPAGFKLKQLTEVPPYHYGAVFERVSG